MASVAKNNIIINHFMDSSIEPNIINGIDTLYYFMESGKEYGTFFLDMLEEIDIQKQKGSFSFGKSSSLQIELNGVRLNYTGQPEGYHYFKDEMEFVYIGFKDSHKQRNLHDIRIRLQARGIYTLGLKSLIEYVDSIVKNITSGKTHITRMDVNAFVQADFSRLCGSMFATKKTFVSSINNEICRRQMLETLYIGKPPFRLRIYNKLKEMEKSKKSELMQEYLYSNGMEKDKPIWNIEFEMHRDFLKQFKILSVDDAINNAENLFKKACDYVRLIDIREISEADIENGHKNRAPTLPVWQKIKEGYSLKEFMQITAPLERVKKRVKKYEYADAFAEGVVLAWKMKVNGHELDDAFVVDVKEELEKKEEHKKLVLQNKLIDLQETKSKVNVMSFASMSNNDLTREQYVLMKMYINDKNPSDDLMLKIHFATKEMEKRGIIEKAEDIF